MELLSVQFFQYVRPAYKLDNTNCIAQNENGKSEGQFHIACTDHTVFQNLHCYLGLSSKIDHVIEYSTDRLQIRDNLKQD